MVKDMQGHVYGTGAGAQESAQVRLVSDTPEPEDDSISCGGSIAESEKSLSSDGWEFGDFK